MSAFEIGLLDAWHPVGLATLLCAMLFFSVCARNRQTYVLSGFAFFAAVWYFRSQLVLGAFDGVLATDRVLNVIRLYYLLMALLFLGYGCFLWKQWWNMRIKKMPIAEHKKSLSVDSKILKIALVVGIAACGYVLGGLNVLTASVATHDYGVFTMIMDAHSKGVATPEKKIISLYILGSLLPLFSVWFFVSFKFIEKFKEVCLLIQPRLTIIASAAYMSAAMALILLFYK